MQWYQMPTFEKWGENVKKCFKKAGASISKFPSFSVGFVKSQKIRIAAYYSLLLVFFLFFWPVFNNWFLWNEQSANINTQYYTCELNEFTHKKDAECNKMLETGWLRGGYDSIHLNFDEILTYKQCGVMPENCRYSIFSNKCQCDNLEKLTKGLEKEAFLHDKPKLESPPSSEVAIDGKDGVKLIPTQTGAINEVYIPLDFFYAQDEYQECKKNNLPNCSQIVMDYLYGNTYDTSPTKLWGALNNILPPINK